MMATNVSVATEQIRIVKTYVQFARTAVRHCSRQIRRQPLCRIIRFWLKVSADFYTAATRLHRPYRA